MSTIVEGVIEDLHERRWNSFRDHYHLFSHEDLKEIYTAVYTIAPYQRQVRIKLDVYKNFFRKIKGRLNVLELGGYDGWLASEIMKEFEDIIWINVEIIKHRTLEELWKYAYIEYELDKPFWEYEWGGQTVFVSNDTIEHFSNDQVDKILSAVNGTKYLMMQIDIPKRGADWTDNKSTHICTYGWKDIDRQLENYRVVENRSSMTWFKFLEFK